MRPTVDLHFRGEGAEDASLTFILQESRQIDSQALVAQLDSFIQDPYFCKLKKNNENEECDTKKETR